MESFSPADREKALKKAIRNGGFYGKNGLWNSIIVFPNDKHVYRHRVETIIIRNGKEVFVKRKPDGEYFLPGGSTEKDVTDIEQAQKECEEEAHIKVKNIESSGIHYKKIVPIPQWAKEECLVLWDGHYTDVYVAEYDSMFKGHIDKLDEDKFIRSGSFIPLKECYKFFRKEHREALFFYIKFHNLTEEVEVQESYISNYFRNKKFLKDVGKTPELNRQSVIEIIDSLKREYSKLNATSKIKREKISPDVKNIFHPVVTLDFTDQTSITIAICFDESEVTDGCAFTSEEYGDIVVVYPRFFKTGRENQIFTILHEIGHVRLDHLEARYSHKNLLRQDNSTEHRSDVMLKGKSVYPENNADLYAVLNGAKMYSILNSSFHKDYDKEFDYRFTNAELASRYSNVFKQYQKLRPFHEEYTSYDLAKSIANRMVYENCHTSHLNKTDKDNLYKIIVKFGIDKSVDGYENVREAAKELNLLKEKGKNTESAYQKLQRERMEAYYDKITKTVGNSDSPMDISDRLILEISHIENEILSYMEDFKDKLSLKRYICESENNKYGYYLYLVESITAKERNSIPLELFGIPETRSYPLDTKKHVESAIKLFGKSEEKYRKELANKIFKAMDKYNIPTSIIGKESKLYKYL